MRRRPNACGYGRPAVLGPLLAVFLFLWGVTAVAAGFRVASWNLENLFDLEYAGTEYPGYVPGGDSGWNGRMLERKLDNTCRVIADLSPEVIGLQEVESEKALALLRKRLQDRGIDYPYAVITDGGPVSVRCALLSIYPVVSSRSVRVPGGGRSILQADLDISGNRLVVFVNHWKSKSGPESRRMASARALAEAVAALPENTDYLLAGDFNSNYDEFRTLPDRPLLNDTGGKAGINHGLRTISGGRLVAERHLVEHPSAGFHYNLWLELAEERRWSTRFFGRPQSPDAILLPGSLYDDKGISYVDNSFDRFDPGYLFDRHRIRRWQRARNGRGRHLGAGYSDHLPVYACFAPGPFSFRKEPAFCGRPVEILSISGLYASKTGNVRYRVKQCTVIYRHGDNAVIKQKDGRAVYVYGAARNLRTGRVYDITVSELKRHYGNLEITGIAKFTEVGGTPQPGVYFISGPDTDLSDPSLENEVIGEYRGFYKHGRFFYGNRESIRLYFPDSSLEPETPGPVRVRHARIGYHRSPEIVIEKPGQIVREDN